LTVWDCSNSCFNGSISAQRMCTLVRRSLMRESFEDWWRLFG
jgi:hypothetical protein